MHRARHAADPYLAFSKVDIGTAGLGASMERCANHQVHAVRERACQVRPTPGEQRSRELSSGGRWFTHWSDAHTASDAMSQRRCGSTTARWVSKAAAGAGSKIGWTGLRPEAAPANEAEIEQIRMGP
jgi:hypothetical protein